MYVSKYHCPKSSMTQTCMMLTNGVLISLHDIQFYKKKKKKKKKKHGHTFMFIMHFVLIIHLFVSYLLLCIFLTVLQLFLCTLFSSQLSPLLSRHTNRATYVRSLIVTRTSSYAQSHPNMDYHGLWDPG